MRTAAAGATDEGLGATAELGDKGLASPHLGATSWAEVVNSNASKVRDVTVRAERSPRKARGTSLSFAAQRVQQIGFRGTPRRNPARQRRHGQQNRCDAQKGWQMRRGYAKQHAAKAFANHDRHRESYRHAD